MATLKTRDRVTLHYTDDGAGRPMVFISGWAMSGNWWQEQRRHFSQTHRVLVLDTRGQGESEKVTHGHRLSRHAADLEDLLTALDLRDVAVIAWSRGTSTVMSYFEVFGMDRIAGLVLSGFLPSLAARPDWPWGFNVPPQQFIDSVIADYPNVVSNMIPNMMHKKLDPDLLKSLTKESLKVPPIAAARMLQDHMNIDWRDLLPFIDRPALIVVGAYDPQAPAAAADASAKLMPDARVAVFAESGHCPFIEEPEAFNRELEAFLARLSEAQAARLLS